MKNIDNVGRTVFAIVSATAFAAVWVGTFAPFFMVK